MDYLDYWWTFIIWISSCITSRIVIKLDEIITKMHKNITKNEIQERTKQYNTNKKKNWFQNIIKLIYIVII